MKLSENWLRTIIDPPVDRAELVQRLTLAGLEVESCSALEADFTGVVAAEIVQVDPHPNADKLRVCQVLTQPRSEPLQIVCGAPNARVGLKAPLAMLGAKLPGGAVIKAATLRGVASQGMLCSARELGVADDSDGLFELPADTPVGRPLAELLDLPDAALELKLTPNRADCLSLRGLAHEIGALFNLPAPAPHVPRVAAEHEGALPVQLSQPQACPHYCGRIIDGIDPRARTPLWMRERLRRSGIRSINVAVDCTQYVMLELGQPLHAFDLDFIQGGIEVRAARAGEALKLLDEREISLRPDQLVIADAEKPLALAGIMGGYDSRVTESTQRLFLESAHFTPTAISGQARKLGLHTDASHRFERGVDPTLPALALERLTELVLSIAGGSAGPVTCVEAAEALPSAPTLLLRAARIPRVLGTSLPVERVTAILENLGMRAVPVTEGWQVTPPARRFDIALEADLIEELVRIEGYARVPNRLPTAALAPAYTPETRLSHAHLALALQQRGYHECLTLAFVSPDWLSAWGMDGQHLSLANPLSADLASMRPSLLPGLAAVLRSNLARQQSRVRLFEIGRAFLPTASGQTHEVEKLAGLVCGTAHAEQWGAAKRDVDFYDLKGDIEQLLHLTASPESFSFEPAQVPYLHPGQTAEIRKSGQRIGVLGALHPKLARDLGLPLATYAFEVDQEALLHHRVAQSSALSRFPLIRRDIAIQVRRDVPFDRIEQTLRQQAGHWLKQLVLFDEYHGQPLPEGSRSLAIGLILQDDSRTLTDQDADRVIGDALTALKDRFNAQLRDACAAASGTGTQDGTDGNQGNQNGTHKSGNG